eukprot:5251213-Amphidinium_carterae.1
MQQFLDWADGREAAPSQEVVLVYFEHLKEASPSATRAQSFKEISSLAFAFAIFGLKWASVFDHPRVKGIAVALALKKQPLKQAPR